MKRLIDEVIVQLILKHELNRAKHGYAARSPELGLAASGRSPEIARRNVERLAVLYFKPFERRGNLEKEVREAQLKFEDSGSELTVVTVD